MIPLNRWIASGKILGKTVNPDGDIQTKDDTRFAVGLFPNYTLGDLKAGLGFDVFIRNIGMAGDESYNNDDGAIVYWQASPQVQYKVGKGTLKTGVAIGSLGPAGSWQAETLQSKIRWQIPVRLSFDL